MENGHCQSRCWAESALVFTMHDFPGGWGLAWDCEGIVPDVRGGRHMRTRTGTLVIGLRVLGIEPA
jgi:hypothetical protein